jgi:hypothetical protein
MEKLKPRQIAWGRRFGGSFGKHIAQFSSGQTHGLVEPHEGCRCTKNRETGRNAADQSARAKDASASMQALDQTAKFREAKEIVARRTVGFLAHVMIEGLAQRVLPLRRLRQRVEEMLDFRPGYVEGHHLLRA